MDQKQIKRLAEQFEEAWNKLPKDKADKDLDAVVNPVVGCLFGVAINLARIADSLERIAKVQGMPE